MSQTAGKIKVRAFANTGISPQPTQTTSSPGNKTKNAGGRKTNKKRQAVKDVKPIIDISSDDDFEPRQKKTPKKRTTVSKKKMNTPATNNKLISDFFKPTPKKVEVLSDDKPKVKSSSPVPGCSKELETVSAIEKNKTKEKNKQSKKDMIQIQRVRRKLLPGTDLKLVSNRYHDEDQSRMSEFYEKTKQPEFGYHTTVAESKRPAIVDGDIDVEACLDVCLDEKTEVLEFDATQVNINDPEQMLREVAKMAERIENPVVSDEELERECWNMELNLVPVVNEENEPKSTSNGTPISHTSEEKENYENKLLACIRSKVRGKSTGPKKNVICPKYKIIAGTTFAVDAFRFGYIEGITHYFLTHFHSDHYIGLKKSFDKPLILSSITASCVKKFVGVDDKYFIHLNINDSITIEGIKITAIDANHCPGAVMFVFEFPNGEISLHTGDFRASSEMESLPIFWNHDIREIYLDTTYLNSKYSLMSQDACIQKCISEAKSFMEQHIGDKVLIVCGAYTIGKEKIWTSLAKEFNCKVWADKNRRQAIQAVNDPEMIQYLHDEPFEAQLHVVQMGIINYDDLNLYLQNFDNIFTHIIAFRPSGWEKNSKPRRQGRISVIGVEYSEHSSYDELKRFVSFLRPKTIISTVPYSCKEPQKTPTIPLDWYKGEIKPKREGTQKKMHEYIESRPTDLARSFSKSSGASHSSSVSTVKRKTALNPSALTRRQEIKERVSQYAIVDTIELDDQPDSQETDYMS